jgi:hypothetical protein
MKLPIPILFGVFSVFLASAGKAETLPLKLQISPPDSNRVVRVIISPSEVKASAGLVTAKPGSSPSDWAPNQNRLINQNALGASGRSGAGPTAGSPRRFCLVPLYQEVPRNLSGLSCGSYGEGISFRPSGPLAFHVISVTADGRWQHLDNGPAGAGTGGLTLVSSPGWEVAGWGKTSRGYVPTTRGAFFGPIFTGGDLVTSGIFSSTPASAVSEPVWRLPDSGIRFSAVITVNKDRITLKPTSTFGLDGAQYFFLPREGSIAGGREFIAIQPGVPFQAGVQLNSSAIDAGTFGAKLPNGQIAWIAWGARTDGRDTQVRVINQGGQPWVQQGWRLVRVHR